MSNADLLLNNKFRFTHPLDLEYEARIVDNPKLDWGLNPFGDQEWTFVLNRMEYLYYLQDASKKHQEHAVYLINNWIENVALSDKYVRTIDTAMRITVWADLLYLVPSNTHAQVIDSLQAQICYLEENWRDKHLFLNWGIIQTCSIIYVVDKVPALKTSIELHRMRVLQMLQNQFTANGYHCEMSTMYLIEVIRQLNKICDIAGFEFVKPYLDRAKASLNNLLLPSGVYAPVGDSDFHYANILDEHLELQTAVKTNNLEDGVARVLEGDFEMMLFNHSHGGGHGHFMNNHLELCYQNQQIFTDCGRFNYRDIDTRYELKSAQSHNTISSEHIPLEVVDSWCNRGYKQVFPIRQYKTSNGTLVISSWLADDIVHNRAVFICEQFTIVIDNCNKKFIQNFNADDKVKISEDNISYDDKVALHYYTNGNSKLNTHFQSRKYNQLTDVDSLQIAANDNFVITAFMKEKQRCKQLNVTDRRGVKMDNYCGVQIGKVKLIISFAENLEASIPYYCNDLAFTCQLAVAFEDNIEILKI